MTQANITADVMKKLDPYITARTQVYSFQVVGHFDRGGPPARVEAVVDTNLGRPRVVYWRNLSDLGRAFNFTAPAP
jgi:hypothetical protein